MGIPNWNGTTPYYGTTTIGYGNPNGSNLTSSNGFSYTMQPPANPSTRGRVVVSEQEIAPNEVPNDGFNFGVFLQQDLSRVYVKQVGGDGLIHTAVYTREQTQPAQENNILQATLQTIMQRLDGIEKKLNYRKPYKGNKRPQPQNREVSSNERPDDI